MLQPLEIITKERNDIDKKLKGWEFSERLYRQIPGDIDFLARRLQVDKRQGAEMFVAGPTQGDQYIIVLSQLTPDKKDMHGNQKYSVTFAIRGLLDTNKITGGTSDPIPMLRNTLTDPIKIYGYEFYIYVDDVQVDYVYLSIGRRKISGATVQGNIGRMRSFVVDISETRHKPILTTSPNIH